MKAIGGYFELELGNKKTDCWFKNKPVLNSSRHALEYILMQEKYIPKQVYLPYYTCKVVLEPLERLQIPVQFYHINQQFEIDSLPILKEDECIIVNNYFGIKDEYVDTLMSHYASKMIVDDAQAFYHDNNNIHMKAFYSPRKFVGVPDGGIASVTQNIHIDLEQDYSTDRSIHLLRRLDKGAEAGFEEFKKDDADLSLQPMRKMSNLTKRILELVNFEEIKKRRRLNFKILHDTLGTKNLLEVPDMDSFSCPMVYPFLSNQPELRKKLIDNRIFVATYWPNVFEWCNADSVEHHLAQSLLPLPIDQRYDETDMVRILHIINEK